MVVTLETHWLCCGILILCQDRQEYIRQICSWLFCKTVFDMIPMFLSIQTQYAVRYCQTSRLLCLSLQYSIFPGGIFGFSHHTEVLLSPASPTDCISLLHLRRGCSTHWARCWSLCLLTLQFTSVRPFCRLCPEVKSSDFKWPFLACKPSAVSTISEDAKAKCSLF